MNVILVDDEEIMLKSLRNRIGWEKMGFSHVYSSTSMQEAIQVIKENPVDLMLCDIEMPGGSGLELFEHVKLYFPKIECIFVTCYGEYDYLRRALQLGSFDYILKPVNYGELKKIIKEAAKRVQYVHPPVALREFCIEEKQESDKDNYIICMKEFINQHIAEPISITEIAEAVHLNSQYAMRLFKSETGMTVLRYMTCQRIEFACRLLTDSNYSIEEIAQYSGISNKSYFIRLFKKYEGISPLEYRAKTRMKYVDY